MESTMLPLGTQAPAFDLQDHGAFAAEGSRVGSGDYAGKPLLVMFICNHCPFVVHIRAELARLGRDYLSRGIGIVAINSNDVDKYPEDSPEKMRQEATQAGYGFPYLFDGSQEVAKAYRAACTPDFFLFDGRHRLVYRGQLDASRPKNSEPLNGKDLRAAMDAVLQGDAPSAEQRPSIGCNIKWRPGNEPSYFSR